MSDRSVPSADAAPRRTTSDLVFGAVAVVAVLLAAFFLFAGEADTGAEVTAPPPEITVVEPRDGEVVSGAFPVVFEIPMRLTLGPSGWTAEGIYHPHVMVDGTELMAGPRDIEALEGPRYRWTIPALPPGEHRVRLQWAGPDHRTLEGGGSEPFTVVVR